MSGLYTAYAEYFATGEGVTRMLLVTRAYDDEGTGEADTRERFVELFGEYMALGCDIYEGVKLDIPGLDLLLSERTREMLQKWENGEEAPGGLEYFASLHVNFS